MNQFNPMLFNTAMVKSIIIGAKTKTRRLVSTDLFGCDIKYNVELADNNSSVHFRFNNNSEYSAGFVSRYRIGTIIWIRETWQETYNSKLAKWEPIYKADDKTYIDEDGILKWKPSIHMPRKYARIFLKVANIRVERLRDITDTDSIAEGIETVHNRYCYKNYESKRKSKHDFFLSPINSFGSLWKSVYGNESWDSNAWVWVYDFEKIEVTENLKIEFIEKGAKK